MSRKNLSDEIQFLSPRDAVRTRAGMYVSTTENPNIIVREIIDNSCDEISSGYGDEIRISSNLNNTGFCFVADNGRGINISYSSTKPGVTQAYLSISELHSGSKFGTTNVSRAGQNGVGSSCTNFLSEQYWLLSRITEENFDKSIPEVRDLWNSRTKKKDLFYVVGNKSGIKSIETALSLKDIEKKLGCGEIPASGFSTIVLFKPDPKIFDTVNVELPILSLQYFLLIQEKFYNRKVSVVIDGMRLNNSFRPYKFELRRTIVPKDTSKNPTVDVYMTFEVDPTDLTKENVVGSINGLVTESGQHITYATNCFKAAIKDYYKLSHSYLANGMKMVCIMLAGDVVFDSQTKVRLRSISKVKQDDFKDVVKDIEKIFKKNPDSWDPYAEKLNELAESMKGLTASMRAQKMIDSSSSGVGAYRMKKDFVKGFVDATAGLKDRWDCELFIVEGNSAGQALVSGRPDTKYFAVLPLRGKILNVTTKTSDQALDSQTIYSIYNCIGLGIDENNVLKDSKTAAEAMAILRQRSRYGKIIICSDNDPDGSIIANELLHLFGKFSRFLLETGMIYRALGPLFRGKSKTTGKDTYYFPDDKADPNTGFPVDLDLKSHISYYKGLGSLTPESGEIEEVFFDKSKRRLIQITPDGLDYMMKLNEDIDERKKLLFNNGILSNPYNFTDL